jgi:hypothetical protein
MSRSKSESKQEWFEARAPPVHARANAKSPDVPGDGHIVGKMGNVSNRITRRRFFRRVIRPDRLAVGLCPLPVQPVWRTTVDL